jgi:predicted PurR-regulated permease PerM
LRGLLTLVLVVGILYFAKPVLVPIALAALFAFILSPLVAAIQRRGLGRVPAVLLVVFCSLVVFGGVAYVVDMQLSKLSEELPKHRDQIRAKIARLRGSGSAWSRVMDTFKQATDEAAKPATKPAVSPMKNLAPASAATVVREARAGPATMPVQPTQVILTRPEESPFAALLGVAGVFLEPVASAALVLVLAIFLLIRREDLRNRLIGLLGHGQLTGATRVLVGSAQRVSRLLFMQLCVNFCYGTIFGLALLCIGVPYWFLWGFLTMILRFVPYVGSWMAAALPVVLSFAIAPGLGQPLLVLAVFISLDLVTANAIEPLLFGHSTGVSPVALLVAAVFWTWIWGPIGLVLSTPLTVCLVVLGKHVPRLRFLSLLLGDQPALSPSVSYYQRLLAGDLDEARLLGRQFALDKGLAQLPDQMIVPALRMARRDHLHAGLTAADETFILEGTAQVLEEARKAAADAQTKTSAHKDSAAPAVASSAAAPINSPVAAPLIFGLQSHHKAEELICEMLAQTLDRGSERMQVISTRVLPAEIEARVEKESPALLFVAVLPPGGVTQARYLCRRLRRKFTDLPIIVGYFGRVRDFDSLLVRLRAAGASYVTTSVAQTRTQILALLPTAAGALAAADASPSDSAPEEASQTDKPLTVF